MKITLTILLGAILVSMVTGYLTDAEHAERMIDVAKRGWCTPSSAERLFNTMCLYVKRRDALDFLNLRDVGKRAVYNAGAKESINEECCQESCINEEVFELC
ncbi:uncharacterized protein [Amphiura filiformis]|uniref:uncharacterized protein n=1 Tax=Amphiura filiformis TaxID=82378 RepID=UPI003B214BD3